jgi:hypothetical protein
VLHYDTGVNAALDPAAWHDMFTAAAAASAGLLGLLFVAMSMHLVEIERSPTLRLRGRVNLQALAAILSVSLAGLIPGQGREWLGIELIAIVLVYFMLIVVGARRTSREVNGLPADVRFRLTLQNALLLFQVASGVSLILGSGPGLYLEAPLLLFAIPVVITFNSWNIVFAPELRR